MTRRRSSSHARSASRRHPSHPVTVTIGGTASPFSDYGSSIGIGNGASISTAIPAGQSSLTVTVTAFFDAAVEGPETVTFTVDGTSATATIADEPAATIAATDAAASEVGSDPATFTVSRAAGASTAYDRPVTVTIGGTASPFVGLWQQQRHRQRRLVRVTIPTGQASMTITVTPFVDEAVEGPETVIFTVEGTSATATIADAPVLDHRVSGSAMSTAPGTTRRTGAAASSRSLATRSSSTDRRVSPSR